MESRTSNLLFAALFSVALISDLHAQATVFPDGDTRKDDLAAQRGLAKPGALTGDKAIAHIKGSGQYDSLSAAITGARYGVKTHPDRGQRAAAANPEHGLLSTFTPDGVRLQIRTGGGADALLHTVTWRLESIGYGAAQISVGAGKMKISGLRIELIRGEPQNPQLVEWFQNTPAGWEHGFTLAERPSANPQRDPLRLVLAVTGDLVPEADATGQNLSLRDAAGHTVVSYARLKVWDATGAELPATMQTGAGSVTLSVNEANARYPPHLYPASLSQGQQRRWWG